MHLHHASQGPAGPKQHQGTPAASEDGSKGKREFSAISVWMMCPLDTVDTDAVFKCGSAPWFSQALNLLAASGVHGVAVDVWWGAVERAPGDYRWTGYRQLVNMVKQAGLKMQAVMSFHACGGNTGDNAHISLPPWVLQCGKEDPDLFHTDRPRNGLGQRNREYLSIWASDARLLCGRSAYECYEDFMKAFREAFAQDLGDTIEEVVVGAGPCGELRFPSYPECNGWRFPGIGEFQCYDRHALASLAQAARAAGHPEWGYGGPHDAGHYNSIPEETGFFSTAGNWDTAYGRFFLTWYSSCLLNHGERLLQMATRIFAASPAQVGCGVNSALNSKAAAGPQGLLAPAGAAAAMSPQAKQSRGSMQAQPGQAPATQQQQQQQGVQVADALQGGQRQEQATLLQAAVHKQACSRCAGAGGAARLHGGMVDAAIREQCCTATEPLHAPADSRGSVGTSTSTHMLLSEPDMPVASSSGNDSVLGAMPIPGSSHATSQPQCSSQSLAHTPFRDGFCASRMQQQLVFAAPPEIVPVTPLTAAQPHELDLAALAIEHHHNPAPSGSCGSSCSTSGGASSSLTVLTSGLSSTGVLAPAAILVPSSQPAVSGGGGDAVEAAPALTTISASVLAPPSPSPTSFERPSGVSMYGAPSMTLISSSPSNLSNCGSGGGAMPDTARSSLVQDLCVPLTATSQLYLSEPASAGVAESALPSPVDSACFYAPAEPPPVAAPPAPVTPMQPESQCNLQLVHSPAGAACQPLVRFQLPVVSKAAAVLAAASQHVVLAADTAAAGAVAVMSGVCGVPQMRQLGQSMGHLSISSSGSLGSTQELSELNSSEEPVQQRSSIDASCSTESATLPSLGRLSSSTSPAPGSLLAAPGIIADPVLQVGTDAVLGDAGRIVAAGGAGTAACKPAGTASAAGGKRHMVTLSLKIPGVHWWYRSRSHAAELTAGYYNTALRDGYEPVVDMCARYGIALTLTCVEMCDGQHPMTAACSPEGLLKQVRVLTARKGVLLSGENALPIFLPQGGVDTVAMERIVINTRAWYGLRAADSVAAQHAALLAAQQSQWKQQQQPGQPALAFHSSLPMPTRTTPCPTPQPSYTGCASMSNSGTAPGAGMMAGGGGGWYGLYNGQCQHAGNGGSFTARPVSLPTGGSACYEVARASAAAAAGMLTTGPLYQREDSSTSCGQPPGTPQPAPVPYNMYSYNRPDGSGFGRSFSDTGRYLHYYQQCLQLTSGGYGGASGLCSTSSSMYGGGGNAGGYPGSSSNGYPAGGSNGGKAGSSSYVGWAGGGMGCGYGIGQPLNLGSNSNPQPATAGLHRDISVASADYAYPQQHHAAGYSRGAVTAASSGCNLQGGLQPRATSAGGGAGQLAVQLGLPGEQLGVAACGLRTDSYADIKEPIPSMRSFTCLRLGPELMTPGVLAPWLRFITGMQQGSLSQP